MKENWTHIRPCDCEPVLETHANNGIWIKVKLQDGKSSWMVPKKELVYVELIFCSLRNTGVCESGEWGPLFVLGWTISPSLGSGSLLEGWTVSALEAVTWTFRMCSLFRLSRWIHLWGANPTCQMPDTGTFKRAFSFNPLNTSFIDYNRKRTEVSSALHIYLCWTSYILEIG